MWTILLPLQKALSFVQITKRNKWLISCHKQGCNICIFFSVSLEMREENTLYYCLSDRIGSTLLLNIRALPHLCVTFHSSVCGTDIFQDFSSTRRVQRTRMLPSSISCQILQCWEAAWLQSPVNIKCDAMEWKCNALGLQDWTHHSLFFYCNRNKMAASVFNQEIYRISVCSGRGFPSSSVPHWRGFWSAGAQPLTCILVKQELCRSCCLSSVQETSPPFHVCLQRNIKWLWLWMTAYNGK